MRKTIRYGIPAVLIAGAFALAAGCSVPSEKRSLRAPDGRERTFRLFVPETLPSGPRPLVVVLHGGGGNGRQMERFGEFDELARAEGFLVAYPDGLNHGWNDGRRGEGIDEDRKVIDDGTFIIAMIDEIAATHAVDPKRVYATGVSNGGFMSHTLGNRFPDRFAAIAPVIGGISPAAMPPSNFARSGGWGTRGPAEASTCPKRGSGGFAAISAPRRTSGSSSRPTRGANQAFGAILNRPSSSVTVNALSATLAGPFSTAPSV